MGVQACICSLVSEQAVCVPRHVVLCVCVYMRVCVGRWVCDRVGVEVVKVQWSTLHYFHMD